MNKDNGKSKRERIHTLDHKLQPNQKNRPNFCSKLKNKLENNLTTEREVSLKKTKINSKMFQELILREQLKQEMISQNRESGFSINSILKIKEIKNSCHPTCLRETRMRRIIRQKVGKQGQIQVT